jgi:predicted ATP-binding protein involved in virulence
LEIVFGDKKVQIILTSHSPFIISDLPKENILFLDKDDKGNCKVVSGLEKQQTFGANIHTLFTEAFFLEDGLIGNFAKQKINDIIKDLKNNPTQEKIEYAEKLINLIGEPVLRIKLTQLLDDVKNSHD